MIFDSDMGPDYDDVGAIAILHALADSGQVRILATMASTRYEGVAAVMNALNTYFKRPFLPVGIPGRNGLSLKDWQHWTDTIIAKYPHRIRSNKDAEDALLLYRRILVAQPDHSVVIVSTGFFTNLATLLKSGPDSYSSLSGTELVKRKIIRLVSMAGSFPEGYEFNVKEDPASSRTVFSDWPTEIILSGFEIGKKILSGLPLIRNESIQNSPIKDVFRICIPQSKQDSSGRMSWDETAVLVAIDGPEPYFKLVPGQMLVESDGKDRWIESPHGHFHLIENQPSSTMKVEQLINQLIMHQPKNN